MNEIDPRRRFSVEAVRKFDPGVEFDAGRVSLNDMARQVAGLYRPDKMSPIMVGGLLRLIEWTLLSATGLLLYASYVGIGSQFTWFYPVSIVLASLLAVLTLELTDCYELSTLMRPAGNLGRMVVAWSTRATVSWANDTSCPVVLEGESAGRVCCPPSSLYGLTTFTPSSKSPNLP